MNRIEILQKGIELTGGDRNAVYGPITENMQRMADICNLLLPGKNFTAADCCTILMANKLAREVSNPSGQYQHVDNAVDGCVYWAARYECHKYTEAKQVHKKEVAHKEA